MDLIRLRDLLAEHLPIGRLACTVGRHVWTSDDPPNRPVFIHRRHCARNCGARQMKSLMPDAEWQDVAPRPVPPKRNPE